MYLITNVPFAHCSHQQSEIQQLTLKLQNLTQQEEQTIARLVHHLVIFVVL